MYLAFVLLLGFGCVAHLCDFLLLNKVSTVEECDATSGAMENKCRAHKIKSCQLFFAIADKFSAIWFGLIVDFFKLCRKTSMTT